jgi:rod shape determining protein RodA
MIFINKRYLCYFDWTSFGLILLLSCIGLTLVFSTTYQVDQPCSLFFKKQLLGISSGILIYFFFSFINAAELARVGYVLYFATTALLLITLFKGSIGLGAQRWIDLGIVKFQPSELAKFFFPLWLTYFFSHTENDHAPAQSEFIAPVLIMLVSVFLILKQPDLGTALIILFSGLILFWLIGLRTKFFLIAGVLLCLTAPISWHFLKTYQKKRVLVFLGQGNNNRERYQIEQSKIAVGSGGLTGKGFLQGTQNQLSFLPESRTDFIFSIICEEFGFLGALSILFLFLLLFLRLFFMIAAIHSFYPTLMSIGLLIHIVLSTIINICMVLDLLPIVGIPLPLISYGVTHTWITFASLGCINSITCQRFAQNL